jgi:hypothetical protein
VPSRHQSRLRPEVRHQPRRGRLDALLRRYVAPRQGLRFRQVGCHDRGASDQTLQRAPSPPLEQPGAVAGPEHRIDHDGYRARGRASELVQTELHVARDVVGGEHPDLDGVGRDVAQQHAQLLEHHRRERRQHLVHALGVLNRQRRDDSGAVNTQGSEDLEVRLETGAPRRIRARDAECDPHDDGW